MRRVVFNADDLGVTRGTNEGIRAACEAGLVRESSLCVTGEAVEEGARVAAQLGGRLGIGLHFSLTLGTPLSEGPRELLAEDGRFLPLGDVLKRCSLARFASGRSKRRFGEGVARELDAQLARVKELGLELTHLNGHHHVHVFPVVREAVLAACQSHAIPYLRLPIDQGELLLDRARRRAAGWLGQKSPRGAFRRALRRSLITRMSNATARLAKRGAILHQAPLRFVGLDLYDDADYGARLLALAAALDDAAYEWMCHPRSEDARFAELDHLGPSDAQHREAELNAWTDASLVEELERLDIKASTFAEVHAAG